MLDKKPLTFWPALCIICLTVEIMPIVASGVTDLLAPAFSHWDKDGVFAWLTVHHIFLLVLTILAMTIVRRGPLSEWGFNFHNIQTSLLIIAAFIPVFGLIELFYMSGRPYETDFAQNQFNNLGWQGFQYFFSGLGEEPLFRGFIIVLLLNSVASTNLQIRTQNLVAIAISTVLFMYAHLGMNWLTLSVSSYDFGQQTKAFQFGILYGVVFIHTRSLFAPIVLHGLSNGITATIGFYFV